MSGRLLLTSDRAVPGGAQLALAHLARPLARRGWEVSALVAEEGDLVDRLRVDGIEVRVDPRAEVLADEAPDVVLSMGAATHAWVGGVARDAQIPAAWWMELTARGRPRELAALALPAEVVAALTPAGADALSALGGGRPVAVIPPGVLPSPVEGHRGARRHVRATLALAEGATLIVLVARLDPIKGQDVALEAVARLLASGRDVHLALVGGAIVGHEGPIEDELRARTEALGITSHVSFVGHVHDAGPWLAAADVAIAPSAHEAFGLAVVEALAHGLPVVASDTDGPRWILDEGRFGLLVPPAEPAALAEALERVVADAALRDRLRRDGPTRAASFTPDAAAARWDRALRTVGPTRCAPAGSPAAPPAPPGTPSPPRSGRGA